MKTSLRLLLTCLLLLALALVAFLWAKEFFDSLYAYRSPLHDQPPTPGQPLGQPLTRQLVFVLVDGLREDTSLKPEVMPFLNNLRQQGAYATVHSQPPSYSQPGYTVLLTGAWQDINDAAPLNLDYEETHPFTQDNLFQAARLAGLKTALSGFYWFEKLIPPASLDARFYTSGEDLVADEEVVAAALPWLQESRYQFVLIHLDQVDYAGHHEGGPVDPRWDEAARRVDSLLSQIVAHLDLSHDTLLITSDHGHVDRGGHGGHEPQVLIEPFVLVGAGVKPGNYGNIQMVDIAPTLAVLLGTNLPASGQGHVLSEMLALKANQLEAIDTALLAQQSQLSQAYQEAIGQNAELKLSKDVVSAHQAAMQTARSARLTAERLPRAVIALIVMLLSGLGLWRMHPKGSLWLLVGASLYVSLFNLLYGVLEKRLYSLSALVSAEDVLLSTAGNVLLALFFGWLVVLWGEKTLRKKPSQAALDTLKLALTTCYLLWLPVWWSYFLNGMVASWTLPDFPTAFLSFLSLLQVLFVAGGGLLLAGISAGVVYMVNWRR